MIPKKNDSSALLSCLLLFFLLTSAPVAALTLYSVQSGGTWSSSQATQNLFNTARDGSGTFFSGGTTNLSLHDIVIQSGSPVQIQGFVSCRSMTVESGGLIEGLTGTSFNVLMVSRDVTVDGIFGTIPPSMPVALHKKLGLTINGNTSNHTLGGQGDIYIAKLSINTGSTTVTITSDVTLYSFHFFGWQDVLTMAASGGPVEQTLVINSGVHVEAWGDVWLDGGVGYGNTQGLANIDLFGNMTIDGGNLFLKTDNNVNDNIFTVHNGGKLRINTPVIGSQLIGDSNPQPGTKASKLIIEGILETELSDYILTNDNSLSQIIPSVGSTMRLVGGGGQAIDPDVLNATYSSIELAGSGTAVLGADITIDDQLVFVNGGIDIGSFNLWLAYPYSSASRLPWSGEGSAKYISTSGSGEVIFYLPPTNVQVEALLPVGNGSYTPVGIANRGGSDDFMRVRIANEMLSHGTTGTPLSTGIVQKTWHIREEDSNAPNTVDIYVLWNAADEGNNFNRTSCFITHYENGEWDTYNASPASPSNGQFLSLRQNVTSYSPFAVRQSGPLPVSWGAITASQEGDFLNLQWRTLTEDGSDYFDILHSTDGHIYKVAGQQIAAGYTTTPRNYAFNFEASYAPVHYLRLRQVDFDGVVHYSRTLQLKTTQTDAWRVLTRTGSGQLIIERSGALGQVFPYQLIGADGRVYKRGIFASNQLTLNINIQFLPKGMYWLIGESQVALPVFLR